jgi:hypothetical protein
MAKRSDEEHPSVTSAGSEATSNSPLSASSIERATFSRSTVARNPIRP